MWDRRYETWLRLWVSNLDTVRQWLAAPACLLCRPLQQQPSVFQTRQGARRFCNATNPLGSEPMSDWQVIALFNATDAGSEAYETLLRLESDIG